MQALLFLLDLAGKVVVGIFLLRFFMQLTRANFRNPIAVALVRFSNPVVLPLRRLIPGWGGMDIASLVAAFAVQAGVIFILGLLFSPAGLSGFSLTGLLLRTLLTLIESSISLYVLLVFFSVLLSWFNRDPYNPLANIVTGLTEPVARAGASTHSNDRRTRSVARDRADRAAGAVDSRHHRVGAAVVVDRSQSTPGRQPRCPIL